MDKQQIAKLAEISFRDNSLDPESVNKIIKQLNGRELREYLKLLKGQEKNLNVYVDHSFELSSEDKKKFVELFPNKHVVFKNDPDLIFGLRITDKDKVINLNIKNGFDQMKGYLNKF